jgi:FkbM family methyltransferase
LKEDLIYDVGFHNGDDTAYYLHQRFRVVAIEANPALVAQGERRFEHEIAAGRLKLLNVGITESEGTFSFWVNEHTDLWSSFDKALASRQGSGCHEVKVRALPLAAILQEYGVPCYLKVDIEGSDSLCIRSLDRDALPKYISCELGHREEVVAELYKAGYRHFKMLNQTTYTQSTAILKNEIGWRLLRKAYLKLPTVRFIVRGLPPLLQPKKIVFDDFPARFQYQFKEGSSSGPFGEETYGRWYSFGDIVKQIARTRHKYLSAGLPFESVWFDVHATW